jgi:hypothetical protein
VSRVLRAFGLFGLGAAPVTLLGSCLDSPAVAPDSGLHESGPGGSVTDARRNESDSEAQDGGSADGAYDGGGADAAAEGASLGLLVDDMTATMGTRIALPPPDGAAPGSYSTYSDFPNSNYLGMRSVISGTAQLSDTPVSPPIANPDGSQLVGKLCVGRDGSSPGSVLNYAGLNLNFAYGTFVAAAQDGGSSALPFDANQYSGVSFYLLVDPLDGGPSPAMRFGVPDTQTADPAAWPITSCRAQAPADAGGDGAPDGGPETNPCDDDFGADLTYTPGVWNKLSFRWSDLAQQAWGAQFPALKPDQLIGMKWQVNGAGADAAIESFYFCISDIYFTP